MRSNSLTRGDGGEALQALTRAGAAVVTACVANVSGSAVVTACVAKAMVITAPRHESKQRGPPPECIQYVINYFRIILPTTPPRPYSHVSQVAPPLPTYFALAPTSAMTLTQEQHDVEPLLVMPTVHLHGVGVLFVRDAARYRPICRWIFENRFPGWRHGLPSSELILDTAGVVCVEMFHLVDRISW